MRSTLNIRSVHGDRDGSNIDTRLILPMPQKKKYQAPWVDTSPVLSFEWRSGCEKITKISSVGVRACCPADSGRPRALHQRDSSPDPRRCDCSDDPEPRAWTAPQVLRYHAWLSALILRFDWASLSPLCVSVLFPAIGPFGIDVSIAGPWLAASPRATLAFRLRIRSFLMGRAPLALLPLLTCAQSSAGLTRPLAFPLRFSSRAPALLAVALDVSFLSRHGFLLFGARKEESTFIPCLRGTGVIGCIARSYELSGMSARTRSLRK